MDEPATGLMGPRPTVRDVARHADVSPSTVSNVLNRRPVVRPETRLRVEEAIAALGYVRSVAARGLRTSTMPVLGLLIEDDSRMAMGDPVHSQLLAGLLERARLRGLGVSVFAAAPETDDRALLRFVASGHAAGVVLSLQGAEGQRDELLEQLAATGVPLVLFERRFAPEGIATVAADNAGGSRALFDHLDRLGHRRYLYLTAAVLWPGPEQRLASFVAAAETAAREVRLARAPGWTVESAHSAALPLLRGELPTAVVAANDHLAAGVIAAAHELGIRVPKDLSIVGFGDLEIAARVTPQLTTVAFDPASEGELAADLLIARIDGQATVDNLLVSSRLLIRSSTAPPRSV